MKRSQILHGLKRFAQRIALRIYKSVDPRDDEFLEHQLDAINVCKKLLRKPESVVLMSPISGKRYIKSEDGDIFVIIGENKIDIVNHQYSYNIPIGIKYSKKIKDFFDNEVENRRSAMENDIKSNVKHSLRTISNSLSNENL